MARKYLWQNLKTNTQPRFKKVYEKYNKALKKSSQKPSAIEMSIGESLFLKDNTVPSGVAQILLDDIEALEIERDEAIDMKDRFNSSNLKVKKELRELRKNTEKIRTDNAELKTASNQAEAQYENLKNVAQEAETMMMTHMIKNALVMKVFMDLVEQSELAEQLEEDLKENGLSMQDVQLEVTRIREQLVDELNIFRKENGYEQES